MKKFITLAIAGIISVGNCVTVGAFGIPAFDRAPLAPISFELGEVMNWQGSNSTIVTQGATDGIQALQVNMPHHSTDSNAKLVVTPANKFVWQLGINTSIAATVTNPGTELIQLRAEIVDLRTNSAMTDFSIPAGTSMDIVLDPANPGTAKTVWGNGIDTSSIRSLKFYFPETSAMKNLTDASYIIDNIRLVQPPAVSTFPTTSFEASESNWHVTGAAPITQFVVTEAPTNVFAGIIDGTSALKVTIPERQSDWEKVTKLHIIPEGQVWDMGDRTMITLSVTNDNDHALQLRANIADADKNTRMVYFSIPANANKEIVIGAEQLGTPGIHSERWFYDTEGYFGKGINKHKITTLEFFIAEPEVAVMEGINNFSYTIDNIRVK
ncbi:hypothetical protein [Candidatus Epulonipiscium viviparus]|uniref:hypothetical protein n=1 Tax=Candidatus Epulonipiscium viviparus TaxID=420336 RepID=UPI0027380FB3|nr:hypothetical protein [Candidatus Epulopiscium viviparus]